MQAVTPDPQVVATVREPSAPTRSKAARRVSASLKVPLSALTISA